MRMRVFFMLILLLLISINLIYVNGENEGSYSEGNIAVISESEGASSEGSTTVITKKVEKPKENFTQPEAELKKLDRYLRSIVIVNNTNENKEYLGFYIGLTEADTNGEFKTILEENALIVTYYLPTTYVYLVFTADNVTQKVDEVSNLPFVEWINKNVFEKVIPINSTEKIPIFISLNQRDNVSKAPRNIGGKILYIYNQPGGLGRRLEQRGVELINYDEDLKGYTTRATPEVIKKLINLDFVSYIEKEKISGVAEIEISYIESTSEKISKREIDNLTIKEPNKIEEGGKEITVIQKDKQKKLESLFLHFIKFLKSLFVFK